MITSALKLMRIRAQDLTALTASAASSLILARARHIRAHRQSAQLVKDYHSGSQNVDSGERETAGLWGQIVLRMKWGNADQHPRRVGCPPSLSSSKLVSRLPLMLNAHGPDKHVLHADHIGAWPRGRQSPLS